MSASLRRAAAAPAAAPWPCCCAARGSAATRAFYRRILSIVMHSAEPGWVTCLPCIGAATRFLQFAPTVHVLVLGAGSSFFAASLA